MKPLTRNLIPVLMLLAGMQPARTEAQPLPPNIDFASGNFSNWGCYTGTAITGSPATGPAFSSSVLSGPVSNRHTITSGSAVDPASGYPIVGPAGGSFSVKIGNSLVGAEADRIRYYVHVPAGTTKYSLQTQFSVVLEDPGHQAEDQPSFQVVAYDSATGAIIPSANNLYIAGYVIPGFVVSPSTGALALPWTASTINLGGMAGKTAILEVTAMDCAPGGHAGYGYFDLTGFTSYLAPTVARCDRDSIRMSVPPGYKYYQWFDQSFGTALNGPADTGHFFTLPLPATAQYYNLVLTPFSSTGIPDTVRTNILNPQFAISASGAAACATPGVPVQLSVTTTATTSLRYTWTGDTGSLSNLSISNPLAAPTHRSSYIVMATDTNGCFRKDTVELMTGTYSVNAGPDRTTCLGTPVSLNTTVSPALASYTYTWTPATGLSSATVRNPSYTPTAAGWRQLVVRVDSGACSVYDTLSVRALPDSFAAYATTTCFGLPTQLHLNGDTAFAYSWSPAQQLSFTAPGGSQHPVFSADTTTTFTITASYPGCPAIVQHLSVTVEPNPVVNLGADTVYMTSSPPIAIGAQVAPGWFGSYSYAWQPSSLVDSPRRPNVRYMGNIDTTLILWVRTPQGCSGVDSVRVMNIPSVAQMPNAFVPGSVNSSFRMAALAPGYTFRSMRVYNRWGKQVFQTSDSGSGWDGSMSGTNAPTGVYVYILEASAGDGRIMRQQGNVTLIR